MHYLKCTFLSLFLLFSFNSAANIASEKAYLCPSCISQQTASTYAINNYAPKLNCYAEDPTKPMSLDNQICGSDTNKVVLINSETGEVYSFWVWFTKYGSGVRTGYRLQADPYQLDKEMKNLYSIGGLSYRELLLSMQNVSKNISNSSNTTETEYISSTVDANTTDSCPENTALATMSDPNKLTNLENNITSHIVNKDPFFQNVLSRLEANNASVHVNGTQIGVSAKGYSTNATINLGQNTNILYIQQGFRESEITDAPPLTDYLLFKIELIAGADYGQPVVRATLSDMSRVAGYTIEQLKGKNGTLKITNQCILKHFDEMSANSAHGGASSGNTGGSSGTGSNGGDAFLSGGTCYQDFFQGGRLLYRFIVPISRCH